MSPLGVRVIIKRALAEVDVFIRGLSGLPASSLMRIARVMGAPIFEISRRWMMMANRPGLTQKQREMMEASAIHVRMLSMEEERNRKADKQKESQP